MPPGARVIHIDDVGPLAVLDGQLQWHPLRHELGIRPFGMNAYTAANAGDLVVEEHTEESLGHEEVYVVLEGRATFTLDGEEFDAPAGTVVHLPDPKVRRVARAAQDGTRVLAVGAKPGAAYEPSPWESAFRAEALARSGDVEGAIAICRAALAERPDNASVLYNLACFEALGGSEADAIGHLRRAFELRPELREWAARDDDLAALRDRLP
jgi:mannose-6-phosphate isomerase-like protein (cupin superfamily)